jgi:hypothetical protein
MKKKQIKLEVPSEKATFFALSSTLSIHKLAWELNQALQLKLSQGNGLKHLDLCFPTLTNEEGIVPFSIEIVKNKFESNLLVKELPNIDYILKIQGDMPAISIDTTRVKGLGPLQNL